MSSPQDHPPIQIQVENGRVQIQVAAKETNKNESDAAEPEEFETAQQLIPESTPRKAKTLAEWEGRTPVKFFDAERNERVYAERDARAAAREGRTLQKLIQAKRRASDGDANQLECDDPANSSDESVNSESDESTDSESEPTDFEYESSTSSESESTESVNSSKTESVSSSETDSTTSESESGFQFESDSD